MSKTLRINKNAQKGRKDNLRKWRERGPVEGSVPDLRARLKLIEKIVGIRKTR